MMRKKILAAALLLTLGLAGCSAKGQSVQTDLIGEGEAKTAALTASGVAQDNATFTKTQLEKDDGKTYYEIEFTDADGVRYEYDIDAVTGTVIAYESEKKGTAKTQSGQTATDASGEIDEATAKQTALNRVPGASASNIYKFKLDFDDGRWEYEGTIVYNQMEYEFTIDANTGSIVEWDVESIYD